MTAFTFFIKKGIWEIPQMSGYLRFPKCLGGIWEISLMPGYLGNLGNFPNAWKYRKFPNAQAFEKFPKT